MSGPPRLPSVIGMDIASPALSTPRLHVLRAGYLILGGGLVVYKWPQLFHHAQPWPLMTSVVTCMLVAMSVLALAGLRYPVRMLPIMLFEVGWKLLWLGVVALPQWLHHTMDQATRDLTTEVLWVVVILAAVPWRYAYTQYLTRPSEPWRSRPDSLTIR
jgi:hypothetical protein